jgi:hypothetical protein
MCQKSFLWIPILAELPLAVMGQNGAFQYIDHGQGILVVTQMLGKRQITALRLKTLHHSIQDGGSLLRDCDATHAGLNFDEALEYGGEAGIFGILGIRGDVSMIVDENKVGLRILIKLFELGSCL